MIQFKGWLLRLSGLAEGQSRLLLMSYVGMFVCVCVWRSAEDEELEAGNDTSSWGQKKREYIVEEKCGLERVRRQVLC